MKIIYFVETIAALGLSAGCSNQINIIKLKHIKGQGPSVTLAKGHSDFKIKNFF